MADKSLAIRLSVNSAEAKANLEALSQSGGQSLDRLADKLRALGVAGSAGAAGLEKAANQNVRGFASLGEAADRFEGRVKGINRGVNDVRGALELMGGPLAGVAAGMGTLTTTIGNVSDVFGVLSNAFLRNPIGLVATGIAAAAAAFVLFRDKTVDATKAQADYAKALEKSNELLETQAERGARVAEQKRTEAVNEVTAALDQQKALLARAEKDVADAERRIADRRAYAARRGGSSAGAEEGLTGELDAAKQKADALRTAVEAAQATLDRLNDPSKLGANREAAQRAADDQAKAYEALRQRLDGVYAANARYAEGLAILNSRFPEGARSVAEYRDVLAQLGKVRDEEIAKADGTADRLKAETDARAKAAQDLARLNEATLRDVAAYVKEHEKRESGLTRFIEKMEQEARLAGETNAVRAEGAAILEAQSKLYDEQGRKVRDLTDAEKARVSAAVRQKEAIEAQRKAAEKFAADYERVVNRATDRVTDFAGDAIYKALTGKMESAWEFFKDLGLRTIAQVAAEMVFRPIIAPIVSAGVGAVASAGFGSALGLGGAAGGAATSAGSGIGLGTVASAAGVGYQVNNAGGFWNAIGNPFGIGAAPAASAAALPAGALSSYTVGGVPLTASEAAQEAVAAGVPAGAGGTSALGAALAAVAPYLTIAGGAFGIYNAIKDPTPTNVIAGLGGAYAGVSAGMGLAGLGVLPFAGPIGLAAAAIDIIGSFFGGKKGSPVIHADQTSRDVVFGADGSIVDRKGPTGYYGASPERYDWFLDMGKSLRDAVDTLGGTAARFNIQGIYDTVRFGGAGELEGAVEQQDGSVKLFTQSGADPEGFGVRLLKNLLQASDGIDAIYKSVADNSKAGNLKDFAADLDFAKNLQDSIAAIGDLGNSLDALTSKAKASAVSMVEALGGIEDRADALGIGDTARTGIAAQIRAWMGNQGPQTAPTATQQALAQISGAFAGLGEAGAKYGISAGEIQAANDNAVARVRGQFEDQIAAILDPGAAALRNFDKAADQMRQDARDLGADLVETERAIAKQRQAILDQQLGGLATNLRSFLDTQPFDATSSLSPEARLAAAQGQFDAALTGARGGDAYQASRLVGTAQELLAQGRAFYGSTTDFATLETWLRATLSQFGQQQGFDGFGPAIQSQTSALITAQQFSTQAIVDGLTAVRNEVARLQNELSRVTRLSLVA